MVSKTSRKSSKYSDMNIKLIFTLFLMVFLLSCSINTKEYDNIVVKIKSFEIPVGQLVRYKIADFSNTSTIKKLPDNYIAGRGTEKGHIWAFKTKQNLLIFIETEDKGHAGQYGVTYSENGQTPLWNNDEWGEFWSTGEKINEHWWKIYFNVD